MDNEMLGRALTRMVDPITTIRLAARTLDEQMQADPQTILAIRGAAARLNQMIKELREQYPDPADHPVEAEWNAADPLAQRYDAPAGAGAGVEADRG